MSAAVALRMVSAEHLKLRRRRGTLIWALVLAIVPVFLLFLVNAIQHSSNPGKYGPAGGLHHFADAIRLLGLFLGPLAAILIGSDAGGGDQASGVFRDLVVTGRSRVALFAVRIPGALALCLPIIFLGWLLGLVGTLVFAGGLPNPGGGAIVKSLLWVMLADGAVCVVAVGLASLTTSRPASLTALIGWQLVASPLLSSIKSLGSARDVLLSQSLWHFDPVKTFDDRGSVVSMSLGVALLVLAVWLALFSALGAWRTAKMDA
jgi:ABC-type transport system involved in multi-copper enzyme maturation permease subunit